MSRHQTAPLIAQTPRHSPDSGAAPAVRSPVTSELLGNWARSRGPLEIDALPRPCVRYERGLSPNARGVDLRADSARCTSRNRQPRHSNGLDSPNTSPSRDVPSLSLAGDQSPSESPFQHPPNPTRNPPGKCLKLCALPGRMGRVFDGLQCLRLGFRHPVRGRCLAISHLPVVCRRQPGVGRRICRVFRD